MPTRIVLIDDHQILRQGLRTLLEQQQDYRVIGEAGDGRSAIALIDDLVPDIAIIDIAMPELNGIEATRQAIARVPHLKVIALSMYADQQFVQDILRAGAAGYLLKESAYEELVTAIRLVLAGQVYLSQKITNLVVKDYLQHLENPVPRRSELLSLREREVWQLLAEGNSSAGIAERLHLSVRTIETYRKNCMDKLEAHSFADLVKQAIREGIVPLEA